MLWSCKGLCNIYFAIEAVEAEKLFTPDIPWSSIELNIDFDVLTTIVMSFFLHRLDWSMSSPASTPRGRRSKRGRSDEPSSPLVEPNPDTRKWNRETVRSAQNHVNYSTLAH